MEPTSLAEMRRFVAEVLHDVAGVAARGETGQQVLLMASELATNAILHGGGREYDVDVTAIDGRVRVEVVDGSRRLGKLLAVGPDDERGRGLHIVAAFADRWGASTLGGGRKAMWFEVRVRP